MEPATKMGSARSGRIMTSTLQHQPCKAFSDPPSTRCGGLAPWQKRRSLELLQQHMRGELRLACLVEACRLSSSHFARSFKKTFGTTVHQYLLGRRVAAAKEMLSRTSVALTEVALETGFSDQAAFNRTFKAITGVTPGQWRRAGIMQDSSPGGIAGNQAA